MRNREGYFVTESKRECTNCGEVFCKTSKTVTLCPSCNSKRVTEQSPEVKMYRRAKARAAKTGIEFSISKEDIKIPERCPILGVELQVFKGKPGGRKNSPALDRKDCSKGYTVENVWVISHLANMMKSNANAEELLKFSNWVQNELAEK